MLKEDMLLKINSNKTDKSKPKGTPSKLIDVGKPHAQGWKAKISMKEGIHSVYREVKDLNWN